MKTHNPNSQLMQVLEHLQSGKEIEPKEASEKYGIMRLSAVIFDLKKEGYNISARLRFYKKPSGTTGHYAIYKLVEE